MTDETAWRPIARGTPDVRGVHSEHSGLLIVRIDLEPAPDEAWAQFFQSPSGVGISLGMHPPRLMGRSIEITPPDNQIEAYVAHVDERIAAANAFYEREVLPRIAAKKAAADQAEKERASRLESARQRAASL